jgi:hypothetical protein
MKLPLQLLEDINYLLQGLKMTEINMDSILGVSNTVSNMLNCIDCLDWDAYKKNFVKGTVIFDYTSLNGGEPYQGRVDDFIDLVIQTLPGYEATCHQTTNHEITIEDNNARFYSNVIATHYIPNTLMDDKLWQAVGFYDIHLRNEESKWKIYLLKFIKTMVVGDCIGLRKLAKERSHNSRKPRSNRQERFRY